MNCITSVWYIILLRYRKLAEAWREAKPPPKTAEEAARLVIQTLKGHKKADVEVCYTKKTTSTKY